MRLWEEEPILDDGVNVTNFSVIETHTWFPKEEKIKLENELNTKQTDRAVQKNNQIQSLMNKLQETIISVDYLFYWGTWTPNDQLDQAIKESPLKMWTNVNREDAAYQSDILRKAWMSVGNIVWKQTSFVISNINETDKYSSWYNNCTGVILFWMDKKTNKMISMLSHQKPDFFLKDKEWFDSALSQRLKEFLGRCDPKSIKSFVWWGNVWTKEKDEIYNESISFISPILERELWQKSETLPPNNNQGATLIKIHTQENKISLSQPVQNK